MASLRPRMFDAKRVGKIIPTPKCAHLRGPLSWNCRRIVVRHGCDYQPPKKPTVDILAPFLCFQWARSWHRPLRMMGYVLERVLPSVFSCFCLVQLGEANFLI